MIRLTLAEIAEAVGGRLHHADGSEVVSAGVEFDSRKVQPGGLFVALPGEHVDGHTFAAQAVAAGATAVLAARVVDAPALVVPPAPVDRAQGRSLAGDTDGAGEAVLAALARLARYVVNRLPQLVVVGVTGSSGKTSTKDLIAQLLSPMGPTVAPPGSFNNELGHPWTVLRADPLTRHLVLELSACRVGDIAALCQTAPPRIGAVLNVGSAHLGSFGSRDAIARAKGELVEALPAQTDGGVAVLNTDDPLVAAMAQRTAARVVLVGHDPAAHVRAERIDLDAAARPSFTLVTAHGSAPVRLSLHGQHHVGNALTAAAVALELGATLDEVAERLCGARRLSARRMQIAETASGVTVVNDAYNASPESARAALNTLASITRGRPGRAWAVLGVMSELGEAGDAAHYQVGRLAAQLHIDRVVVVDEQARHTHRGACEQGPAETRSVLVPDIDAATALLRDELRPGDVVLTKASNTAQLWRVAENLLAGAQD